MGAFEDAVAAAVLQQYESLPAKRKPRQRSDGQREWVPLSGVVLSRGRTGNKCLPQWKVPLAKGIVLHDWHAETLAVRCFNRFLIQECHDLVMSTKEASRFIRRRAAGKSHDQFQPFSFKEDIRIHLYCSEAPCGDASMELIMAAQQDATPWPTTSQDDEEENPVAPLHGRGYFSKLGVVRRKPARSDAPPTLSKSCTDKLALKQSTSLLSSLTSLLISPENAYLHTLVLPASQYSAPACERAFGAAGRLRPLSGKRWPGSYSFRPFVMGTTKREFDFSGRGVNRLNEKRIPSNLSALWTPHLEETCINGGLQGRKQFHVKGASTICNRGMWTAVAKCISMVDHAALATLAGSMSTATYHALKCHEVLEHRRNVKSEVREKALQGWLQNLGDDFYTQ